MIGKQILNYKIESLLGEGGMGSVYLAVHTQLGRKVAIKALNPSLVKNPGIRARFKNEASTLSQLHHPSIVILFDYLEEESALYLIMEYVEGKTLDEYIQTVSGPIPENKAIPLFTQVLDGFAYAHEQGVIHRDVKPANIMITAREKMKILDFGIAKLLSQKTTSLTQAGTKMGTVLYMSPEQIKGETVDKRSDIYSLGVTLFQMLTGRGPYDDLEATEFAVSNKIVNEPLPRVKSFYPNISERMQSVIDKATAKNSADRFRDCQEFKEALLGNIGTPLVQPAVSVKPTTPEVAKKLDLRDTIQPDVRPEKKKKSSAGKVLFSLMLTLIVISGTWFFATNKEEPTQITKGNNQAKTSKGKSENTKKSQSEQSAPSPQENEVAENLPSEPEANQEEPNVLENIQLIYEPANRNESEEDNKFTVLIILKNKSSDINFDNVAVKITYFNESDAVVGNYIYDHGKLEAGIEERFLVDRKVRASRVECSIASADPVKPEAEEIL